MNIDLNIIKVLLTNKNLALDFAQQGTEILFKTEYWHFVKFVLSYIKTYKDVPTERIIKEKLGTKQESIKYLDDIFQSLSSINYNEKEFKFDVDKLKKRYSESKISSLRNELSNTTNVEKSIQSIRKSLEEINTITKASAYDRKTLKDNVDLFKNDYNAKLEARKNGKEFIDAIKTGYSTLDSSTGGLREAELFLIAGESGAGKSTMLLNMAIQMWMQDNTIDSEVFTDGHNGVYFSLEMPRDIVFNRVVAKLADVNVKRIKSAKLTNEERARVKKALSFIERYPYNFEIIDSPRGTTIETIESIYVDIKAAYNPKFVAIDYLQLMKMPKDLASDESDWLTLGIISESLHEFARVHKTCVLSAVQLNRPKQSKEIESNIGLHRIGRSNEIAKNANIIVQIYSRVNEQNYPDLEYYIIKNRDGDLKKGRLIKRLECATLLDEEDMSDEFVDMEDLSSSYSDILGF